MRVRAQQRVSYLPFPDPSTHIIFWQNLFSIIRVPSLPFDKSVSLVALRASSWLPLCLSLLFLESKRLSCLRPDKEMYLTSSFTKMTSKVDA
jgi:hypothetical protein